MSTKKNLPNIPIYIGDWERDCNVLSLESEAAWMRIVFKLWQKGKQNSIKVPAKSLQNLWRCDFSKMNEILDDLIFNDICDIEQDDKFITFTCRRFVRENELSEIRSNSGRSAHNKGESDEKSANEKQNSGKTSAKSEQNFGKTPANLKQDTSKLKAKRGQITDNDNDSHTDNESDNEKGGVGEKAKEEQKYPVPDLKSLITNEVTWRETIIKNMNQSHTTFNLRTFWKYFDDFIKKLENDGVEEKTIADTKKHFNSWLNIKLKTENGQSNSNEKQYGRQSESSIRENLTGW